MIYSAACEYAIRASTHLALRDNEDLVKLREIADAEDIPAPFLATVLQRLVAAGILRSSRGPTGGYSLTRPPSKISLLDIRAAVDGVSDLDECGVGLGRCSDDVPCPLHEAWMPVRKRLKDYLRKTTLSQVAEALIAKRAILASTG
jgi:Rrf2 family protein